MMDHRAPCVRTEQAKAEVWDTVRGDPKEKQGMGTKEPSPQDATEMAKQVKVL